MPIPVSRLQDLLARARANAAAAKQRESEEILAALATEIEQRGVEEIDTSNLLPGTDEEVDEQLSDIIEGYSSIEGTAPTYPADEVTDLVIDDEIFDAEDSIEEGAGTSKVKFGVARDDITLNDKQQTFCDLVVSGEDVVLIGAAGTGKTTSVRQTSRKLMDSGRIKKLTTASKYLQIGTPGIVVTSFTRKAVANIRRAVIDELKSNTWTMHKLLEFSPVFYEIPDPANPGRYKVTMKFEPQRGAMNPLPDSIECIFYEEGSMIGTDLYLLTQAAMPHPHQEVFLGDIQQLPPVFGWAILGFKMNLITVIELTEVYRQALESPIIALAHKLLEGNPHNFSPAYDEMKMPHPITGNMVTRKVFPILDQYTKKTDKGEVVFHVWQKKLDDFHAMIAMSSQLKNWIDTGFYKAEEDMILCPFNKSFGTIELNKVISNHLGMRRKAVVHEVIAGFLVHYLAVGDRVMYDKEDAFIVDIKYNASYLGKSTRPSSVNLDRWGGYRDELTAEDRARKDAEEHADEDILEQMLQSVNTSADEEERVHAASHVVTIRFASYGGVDDDDTDEEVLTNAAQINALLGGYAITVHKAQGSEYERVFLFLHNSHYRGKLNSRELLYTAVTRARSYLYIVCEPDQFEKGIKSQAIRGNTIEQKKQIFMGVGELREFDEVMQRVSNKSKFVRDSGEAPADAPVVTEISGKRAVKLSDLVPADIEAEAREGMKEYWEWAKEKFSFKGDIGDIPHLSFNLSRRNTLGLADYRTNTLKLNPVWTALAKTDSEVHYEMLVDTIQHELMHFVAHRLWGESGHGKWWKLCMVRMGLKPDRLCQTALPNWMSSKTALLDKIFAEHADTLQEKMTEKSVSTEVTGTSMSEEL